MRFLMFAALCLVCSAPVLTAGPKQQAPPPPLKVTQLEYSHPAGISYDPDAELTIKVTLRNQSGTKLDLSRAAWKLTLSRERMIAPRQFWHGRFQEVKVVRTGRAAEMPQALPAGATTTLSVGFKPGRYGFFFLKFDPAGDGKGWLRLCGCAVMRKPAAGQKPRTPYQAGGIFRNPEARAQILGRYGIKAIRCNARLAPQRQGDAYDWAPVDRIMQALKKHDLMAQVALLPVGFFEPPKLGGKLITYYGGRKFNSIARREDLRPISRKGTFAHFVEQLLKRYADRTYMATIRNEPWEGGSISNWHATAAYMREVLTVAREVIDQMDLKGKVLLAGTDSIDNTVDQIAIARKTSLLDAVTHHPYGGKFRNAMAAAQPTGWGLATYDNESWISPEDMCIITVSTLQLAVGYRQVHPLHHPAAMPALGNHEKEILSPRPIGQVVGTWLHFVEDTDHSEELNPEALPHIHLFKARGKSDKHVGILFGRVKLYGHRAYTEGLVDEAFPQVQGNGQLTLLDPDGVIQVFDVFGNAVKRQADGFVLPLNAYPFYLVSANGYADLKAKLARADIRYDDAGVQLALKDLTLPLSELPPVRVRVSNCIRRRQRVTVSVKGPAGWAIKSSPKTVTLAGGAATWLSFAVRQTRPNALNSYSFTVTAVTPGGKRELTERLHVAVFEKGTPTIDGDLSEWAQLGAVPTCLSGSPLEVDWQQKMWFPMAGIEARDENDVRVRFAGMWDARFFYIMAEVHDPTENYVPPASGGPLSLTHGKPFDYIYWKFAIPGWGLGGKDRRLDGIKVAFNLFPVGEKEDPLFSREAQRRLDTRFHRIGPDYEYDLYLAQPMQLKHSYDRVRARHLQRLEDPPDKKYKKRRPPFEAPVFTPAGPPQPEVWRRVAPGVPRHRYYPFSPRWKKDQGVVPGARLAIVRKGDIVRYEAAIPWQELARVQPEVGKEVRFAWFVWDRNKLALDWARDRSVAAGAEQILIPFKKTAAIETPWRFIDATEGAADAR